MAPRNTMLAAAGLFAGGYVATQAFVPSASGPVVSTEAVANLRGASAAPSQGFGSGTAADGPRWHRSRGCWTQPHGPRS